MPVSFLLNLFRSHGKAWKKFGWKFLFEVICTDFVNFKNFYKPPPTKFPAFLSKVIGQSLLKSALFARNQRKINVNLAQKWHIDCCILISSEKSSPHEIVEKESKMDAQLTLPSFSGNMLIMFSLFFAISEINMINQALYPFCSYFFGAEVPQPNQVKNSLNISESFFSKSFYLGSSVLHEDREPWILRNTKYWIFYILFVRNKVKLGSKTDNLYFGPLTKTVKTGEM